MKQRPYKTKKTISKRDEASGLSRGGPWFSLPAGAREMRKGLGASRPPERLVPGQFPQAYGTRSGAAFPGCKAAGEKKG